MRVSGQQPLVSVLKVLIDVAYWIALVGAALLLLAVIPLAVFQPQGVSLDLPARLEIDPSAYSITPTDGSDRTVSIGEAQVEVKIRGVDAWQTLQGFAAGILLLAAGLIVLYQLRGIFRTLKAGRPFVHQNVRRMRILGFTLILGELLRAVMITWSSSQMSRSFISEGVDFQSGFEVRANFIFAGLLVLVLAEVFREAASMKRDLETAREIQFSLIPAEEFRQDPIVVRSHMRPANTVGGDYYDIIQLGDGKVAVVQADVAGKGMPAALLMAVLQGSLRTLISAGLRGRQLVDALNDYLHDNTPSNRMVTLFYGELDLATGEMSYVNAGHSLPFLIRRDGGLERPSDSSMVLGIVPHRAYPPSVLRLEPGDRLLLFTDGISEASDRGDNEYGDERVEDYLRHHQPRDTGQDLVDGLVSDVLRFCKPAAPVDDMTLTLITRSGA
jgi:serine phosphatase RsbU (regulator of sigma subunit)